MTLRATAPLRVCRDLSGGPRLLGKTVQDRALCEGVGLGMSSKPLPQRRALSATTRLGGSETVPTGCDNVIPCSILCHLAPVPLPAVRTPLLHSQMPIRSWDPTKGALAAAACWLLKPLPVRLGPTAGAGRRRPSGCQVPSTPVPSSGRGGGERLPQIPPHPAVHSCTALPGWGTWGLGDREEAVPL